MYVETLEAVVKLSKVSKKGARGLVREAPQSGVLLTICVITTMMRMQISKCQCKRLKSICPPLDRALVLIFQGL